MLQRFVRLSQIVKLNNEYMYLMEFKYNYPLLGKIRKQNAKKNKRPILLTSNTCWLLFENEEAAFIMKTALLQINVPFHIGRPKTQIMPENKKTAVKNNPDSSGVFVRELFT